LEDLCAQHSGSVIRRIRKSQKITLSDLSQETGLSISFISQVERGIANPSIISLRKIAYALGTTLSSFFDESELTLGPVVRKEERKVIVNKDSRLIYQLLSPNQNRRIELLLSRLDIRSTSAESPIGHKGDEAALILQGECRIQLGDDKYDLKEGDSIYIVENTPHKFTNTGNVPLIIVSAISPPGF